jgi:hypothetical protein
MWSPASGSPTSFDIMERGYDYQWCLLGLVKKDLEFEMYAKEVGQNTDKLRTFWGRFAFGERWAEKRSRLAALSPYANRTGWDLNGIIVKSNDDLRQESVIMQLVQLCQKAFQEAEHELWILPYRIISTGHTTGIIEMVRNAMSFDALKNRPGYGAESKNRNVFPFATLKFSAARSHMSEYEVPLKFSFLTRLK